jgi:hypothetical protein
MIRDALLLLALSIFLLFGYIAFVEPLRTQIEGSNGFPGSIASNILSDNSFIETKEGIQGSIQFIQEPTGEEYVRFYNLKRKKSFPGCRDLRVLLTNTFTPEGATDIGNFVITAGDVNYTVPTIAQGERYTHVMLWCKSFRTSYGIAEIYDKSKISIIKIN